MTSANLTFRQRYAGEPAPTQLDRQEVSPQLRSLVWFRLHASIRRVEKSLNGDALSAGLPRKSLADGPWRLIFLGIHVFYKHRLVDEFQEGESYQTALLKEVISTGEWDEFYGIIEWILKDPNCPNGLISEMRKIFRHCLCPWHIMDDGQLIEVGNEELASAINAGMIAASTSSPAAKTHLSFAVSRLNERKFADSVRESLNAAESMSRKVTGEKTMGKALNKLELEHKIHPSMQEAFKKLYGYGSDETGIRHPLIEGEVSNVTEADALFMLGTCAAFVSYLSLSQ